MLFHREERNPSLPPPVIPPSHLLRFFCNWRLPEAASRHATPCPTPLPPGANPCSADRVEERTAPIAPPDPPSQRPDPSTRVGIPWLGSPRLLLRRQRASETCARLLRRLEEDARCYATARGTAGHDWRAPPHRGATQAANTGAQLGSTEPRRGLQRVCGFQFIYSLFGDFFCYVSEGGGASMAISIRLDGRHNYC